MTAFDRLTFKVSGDAIGDPSGLLVMTPEVDGVSLIDLVRDYEQRHGFQPSGGYGGLVPSHPNYGDPFRHFVGDQPQQRPRPGHAWLLACDCGDVGCWPLTARVTALADTVSWSDFTQDHRPNWDYGGFGPFKFRRAQ